MTFRSPWYLGFSTRARSGWAPAPGLADWNPFPGHLLPALGALCLPGSSGTSLVGQGRFGGHSGTAPRGAGDALGTLCRLSRRPRGLRGASPPGGLRRGAPGMAGSPAGPRGGCSLRAQGQASLARPQLRRGARGVDAGLGSSSGHRDGGGVVRAAGRVHVGHPMHGQQGRRYGLVPGACALESRSPRPAAYSRASRAAPAPVPASPRKFPRAPGGGSARGWASASLRPRALARAAGPGPQCGGRRVLNKVRPRGRGRGGAW